MTTTPSLGNTPTTTITTATSSFDSSYDFNTRPLPRRQNPLFSTSAGATKGIDLVTPHIPPPPIDVAHSPQEPDRQLWERKVVISESTAGANGLGALFGGGK